MQIQVLEDNNRFLELSILVNEMYKSIDPDISEFGAVNTLANAIAQPDFTAIVLVDEDNRLAGFTIGHFFNKKSFYFLGIYVIIKNNEWTKKLIDFSFAHIKEKGYTSWLVDATNPNISSIMEKYGAISKFVRYEGEL
jgi:hypothetical protein